MQDRDKENFTSFTSNHFCYNLRKTEKKVVIYLC